MRSASGGPDPAGLKQWQRPEHLDRWGLPAFSNERWLFHAPMIEKHRQAMIWSANQIGFLTRAAIDELVSRGLSVEEAVEKLKPRLHEVRRKETETWLASLKTPLPKKERNARLVGLLYMRWEAALGASGEIMINTPERFVRRVYDLGPAFTFVTPQVLDVIRAEGEGLTEAINPRLTFRTNRYACAGDPFDEWVVEPKDETSLGRDRRIP